MAYHHERWITLDEHTFCLYDLIADDNAVEKIPLHHLQVTADGGGDHHHREPFAPTSQDFEFVTCGGGSLSKAAEEGMCAADEVFFEGQILPLHPSSRCESRLDSLDRCSSSATSGFTASRSGSSSSLSSGGSSSRRHSSNGSFATVGGRSASNNFYTQPSPSPQIRQERCRSRGGASRRSTGALPPPPGWGLFRLGLVKAPPEIELSDLRSRGRATKKTNTLDAASRREIKALVPPRRRCSNGGESDKKETGAVRILGIELNCRCSADAVAEASSTVGKKKEEKQRLKKEEVTSGRRRIIEWVEKLPVTK